MEEWLIQVEDTCSRKLKKYEKKCPNELRSVKANLARYFEVIKRGVHPQFVTAGYIHNEGKGVKALDQKGSDLELRETRLYVYPDLDQKILYLITIGDKKSQSDDIKLSHSFIKKLKGTKNV